MQAGAFLSVVTLALYNRLLLSSRNANRSIFWFDLFEVLQLKHPKVHYVRIGHLSNSYSTLLFFYRRCCCSQPWSLMTIRHQHPQRAPLCNTMTSDLPCWQICAGVCVGKEPLPHCGHQWSCFLCSIGVGLSKIRFLQLLREIIYSVTRVNGKQWQKFFFFSVCFS